MDVVKVKSCSCSKKRKGMIMSSSYSMACAIFWTEIVTEACGYSLREYVKTFDHQIVPVLSSIQIATDIAHAVAHIHGQQLLHRDIHMGNVLINVRQEVEEAKVCDSGLSICVRGNVQNPQKQVREHHAAGLSRA